MLVAYYTLDEYSGQIEDYSGNGNTGTNNGAEYQASQFMSTGAMGFDSSNSEYVSLDTNGSVKTDLPISINAWVNFDDLNDRYDIITTDDWNRGDNQDYHGVSFGINTNGSIGIEYGDGDGSGPSSRRSFSSDGGEVNANQWVMLTGIIRGPTDADLYLNAKPLPVNTSGTGGSIAYSGANGTLGWSVNAFLNGDVSDVRVYDHALSATEVNYLYQVARDANYTSPKKTL